MRIPDAGDAVGNGDARQASAARECEIPMLVTLLGMVMLVRPVQLWNALPMLVTLSGMMTLVRPVQYGMRNPRCW